jgi:hypothetical protein
MNVYWQGSTGYRHRIVFWKGVYLEQMAQAPFIPRGVSLAHSHGAYSSPHQEWKQALGSRKDIGTVTVP